MPGEQQQLAKRMLELGEFVRVVVQQTQQGFRYSVYSLYWYKSTSTDAAGPSATPSAARELSSAATALLVQRHKY